MVKFRRYIPPKRSDIPPLRDDFNKSRAMRERNGRFNKTSQPEAAASQELSLADVQAAMKDAEREAMKTGTPRPSYCFGARDVAALYSDDEGGVYFRLRNGQIFNQYGEPESLTIAPELEP